jgi:hypothetical protein
MNPKTVAKWKKRSGVQDAPMGPKQPSSTVLNREDEALLIAFRKHTLLPLDACLYALQATLPHLPRSALQRCPQRHGISRLPDSDPSALKEPLYAFLMAYNFAKRLKTLRGLTPDEYICQCWHKEPDYLTVNPCHHTLGRNTAYSGQSPARCAGP